MDAYIQNQYSLDEELQTQFEAFLSELKEEAEQFQSLIDGAFSPNIQDALMQSAALARAAGVKEEELLQSIEDIDTFNFNNHIVRTHDTNNENYEVNLDFTKEEE